MFYKGSFVFLACVIASSIAGVIPILSQSEEYQHNGTYKFSYETGNGIIREEVAYEKLLPKGRDSSSNEGGESNESDEIHVQRGSYSYTAPDGTIISVSYIADENGFQPIYEHIPSKDSLNSAEKSGRALKLEIAEIISAPAPKISSTQDSEINSDKKILPQAEAVPKVAPAGAAIPELVPEVASEVISAVESEVAPSSASEPAPAPGLQSEATSSNVLSEISTVVPEVSTPISEEASEKVPEGLSVSVPEEVSTVIPQSEPESDPQIIPSVVPEVASLAASESASEKDVVAVSTENVQSETELGVTEASESTTAYVDVSTIAASTAAPDQPSTAAEQGTTASAELPSSAAPEQSASSEVTESPNSTSAPEQSSTSEAIGQQSS